MITALKNLVVKLWRTLRLRCPQCGGDDVRDWFGLHDYCPDCGWSEY